MPEPTLEFITLRQPERIKQRTRRLRYIRDLRSDTLAPFRDQLSRAEVYAQKVVRAHGYANGPLFYAEEEPSDAVQTRIEALERKVMSSPIEGDMFDRLRR